MNLSQTNITNGNLIRANGPDTSYSGSSNIAADVGLYNRLKRWMVGGSWMRFSPSHWIEKEENDEELKIKVSSLLSDL
jgi:hypothetical protein